MKKIYLILAHTAPEQLKRLILRLDCPLSIFYIHVDLKSDLEKFEAWEELKKDNIVFVKNRVNCIWGDFSMVNATLNLIENVITNEQEGLCVLISGSDYPIKSLEHIDSFLSQNYDKIFIDLKEADQVWPEFKERVEKYRINLNSGRGQSKLIKSGISREVIKMLLFGQITINQFLTVVFKKRNLNLNMEYFGGSQWWAMNLSNLSIIFNYIQENKKVLFDFFQYSHVPDEFFFHSIIMKLKENGSKFDLEPSLTYVNWSRLDCPLPVTFNSADYGELASQPEGRLFARKFHPNVDSTILDLLDQSIEVNKLMPFEEMTD